MSASKTNEFFEAVKAGDLAKVTTLLDSDPSLASACNEQAPGQSPILVAIRNGRCEVRDLLLARGVELDFFEATVAGQFDRVKELIEKDPLLAKSWHAEFGQGDIAEYLRHLSLKRTVAIFRRRFWLH